MEEAPLTILVVGATGSVGRHVVAEALASGHRVRALVRNPSKARLPPEVELFVGDLAIPAPLAAAVEGVDAVGVHPRLDRWRGWCTGYLICRGPRYHCRAVVGGARPHRPDDDHWGNRSRTVARLETPSRAPRPRKWSTLCNCSAGLVRPQ